MDVNTEQHARVNWLRDVILGGQDGLVNVLGIVLGVAVAGGDHRILIAASLAAAFAEAVSMGAVAYTSTMAGRDHYTKELEREKWEMEHKPEAETQEIRDIYAQKGFSGKLLEEIVAKITSDKKIWLEIMMREELDLVPVETRAVFRTSVIVGVAALAASFIPILPFFFLDRNPAVVFALIASGIALFGVGVFEAKTFVGQPVKSGVKMVLIGLGAAVAGFLIGKIFGAG